MITDRTAIAVQHVSKTFRLSTDPVYSLKERLVRLGRSEHVEFHALRDADLVIDQGQTVGILGHNGSGKSTLLKCIAGILTPTSGQVLVRGRLTSLLELGAGFHPELTGRENVYINAAFYGMGRKDIDRRFDQIVDFSELHKFIDEPVKHYSSGMYVRLGFAVAVNLDPDVLLVDEVLAVGDELFQAKCVSRIKEFQAEGRTIVFVTHDASTVRQICDRAIVVDHGRIVLDGSTNDAVRVFREHLHGGHGDVAGAVGVDDSSNAISAVSIRHEHESTRSHVAPGERVDVVVDIRVDDPVVTPVLAIELNDRRGNLVFGADTQALGMPLGPIERERSVVITLDRLWLLDGEYPISLKLIDQSTGAIVGWRDAAARFEVTSEGRAQGTVALDVTIR